MTSEDKKRLWNSLKNAAQTLRDALAPRCDCTGMMFMPSEIFDVFFGVDAHLKNDIIYRRSLFGFEVHQSYGMGNRIILNYWCNDKFCIVRDADSNEVVYRKVLLPARQVNMQIDVDKVLSCPE